MFYKAQCGLQFSIQSEEHCGDVYCGNFVYEDEVHIAHCPYAACAGKQCRFKDEFKATNPLANIADCEVTLCNEPFDYEQSADKISKTFAQMSVEKSQTKFGSWCLAQSQDGKGGVQLTMNKLDTCGQCFNTPCVVTGKKRDIKPVYICKRITIKQKRGFIDDISVHKDVKIHKTAIPMEYAKIAIADNEGGLIVTDKLNHPTERSIPDVLISVEYYIKGAKEKRNVEADDDDRKNGVQVFYDDDCKKIAQQRYRERKEKRQRSKALKSLRQKQPKQKQLSIFDE